MKAWLASIMVAALLGSAAVAAECPAALSAHYQGD
jgi:hypothetical protein